MADTQEMDAEKAFFVGDLSRVYRQHLRWKLSLPDIEPFYLKPRPVLALGVDPSHIIFANPCKTVSSVCNARRLGVDMMTFDNADELHKISRAHPNARLVIRILPDDSKSIFRLGLKFGAPLAAVPGLLAEAKELALDVVGVSFHVGSGDAGEVGIRHPMGTEAGYQFTLLDVGGGFEDMLFDEAAAYLRDAIAAYFPDSRGIRIIAEPGRFYVANAFHLAVNIIARRAPFTEAPPNEAASTDEASVMYYINDGVYGALNTILFDHKPICPYVLSMGGSFHISPSKPLQNSGVWGPTCDSSDCVCPAMQLPSALRVGDWLGFDNMGAYCASCNFNGFEVSKVTYTTGGGSGAQETRSALAKFAAAGHGL
ncbi:ornithine decarboxylase [Mycena latifolia]|nr:ornithine decarboxylase [Mycena latifolia]